MEEQLSVFLLEVVSSEAAWLFQRRASASRSRFGGFDKADHLPDFDDISGFHGKLDLPCGGALEDLIDLVGLDLDDLFISPDLAARGLSRSEPIVASTIDSPMVGILISTCILLFSLRLLSISAFCSWLYVLHAILLPASRLGGRLAHTFQLHPFGQ